VARIIDEGMNRSEAMVTASALMDRIGPRLTNSDNFRKAEGWAIDTLRSYGLANVHAEPFEFGLGWNLASYSATMTAPRGLPLTVIPVAWSPPTGARSARRWWWRRSARKSISRSTRASWRARSCWFRCRAPAANPGAFKRLSEGEVSDLDKFDQPRFDPDAIAQQLKNRGFARKLSEFLKAEGALAMVKISYRDGKLVHGEGYDFTPGQTLALPAMEMAQEDYRRLVRLAQTGAAPALAISIDAAFQSKNTKAENIIAEIPAAIPRRAS
jgi:hypothetical protein